MKYVWGGDRAWHESTGLRDAVFSAKPKQGPIITRRLPGHKLHTTRCGVDILKGAPMTDDPTKEQLKGPVCENCDALAKGHQKPHKSKK
jgi:hypothetical protein